MGSPQNGTSPWRPTTPLRVLEMLKRYNVRCYKRHWSPIMSYCPSLVGKYHSISSLCYVFQLLLTKTPSKRCNLPLPNPPSIYQFDNPVVTAVGKKTFPWVNFCFCPLRLLTNLKTCLWSYQFSFNFQCIQNSKLIYCDIIVCFRVDLPKQNSPIALLRTWLPAKLGSKRKLMFQHQCFRLELLVSESVLVSIILLLSRSLSEPTSSTLNRGLKPLSESFLSKSSASIVLRF